MQRYARIDLGVRIKLQWQPIRDHALKTGRAMLKEPLAAADKAKGNGPHAAIGTIHYRDGTTGVIVYIKSSVTGDEYDEILDYKYRSPDFPHETTGDQFFNEEHFEVYRSLGCHAMIGLLNKEARRAYANDAAVQDKTSGFAEPIDWVRKRLGIR